MQSLPSAIPTSPTVDDIASGHGNADLCAVLVPTYLPALPQDPGSNNGADITSSQCGNYDSHYSITQDANHRVTVSAPSAELGATISVSR